MQTNFKTLPKDHKDPPHRGSEQNFHTRISRGHPRRTFIQSPMQSTIKILIQRPLEEDFNRISTWSPHKMDLHKIMQGPLRRLHQNLYKTFSQIIVKDFDPDLHAGTPGPTRSSYKKPVAAGEDLTSLDRRNCQEHPGRAFIQTFLRHGICKIFMQGPPRKDLTTISTRFWQRPVQIMHGPLQVDFTKISTRSSHSGPVQNQSRSRKDLL